MRCLQCRGRAAQECLSSSPTVGTRRSGPGLLSPLAELCVVPKGIETMNRRIGRLLLV